MEQLLWVLLGRREEEETTLTSLCGRRRCMYPNMGCICGGTWLGAFSLLRSCIALLYVCSLIAVACCM